MNGEQHEVTEFQGFYGPFTVPEKLLQKIWLRGDFDSSRCRTADGEPVEVLFSGKWNLLGGPDFREARLRIGGREVGGDVEIHFHCADWFKHRHHLDPAYERVVLHVLLFHPKPGEPPAETSGGSCPPAVSLLELLYHDLEEYAAEDALEATLERSHWQATEHLLRLPLDERRELLLRHARARWDQKVHFSHLRLQKLGWEEACHQTALEILGYRRNRSAMLNVAARCSIARWRDEAPKEEELLRTPMSRWQLQGARPANHPRLRLRQYARWMSERPDWPERLRQHLSGPGEEAPADGVSRLRGQLGLRRLREILAREITGGEIGGTRLDTLFCDGFLPLAAAAGQGGLFPLWFCWYPGDLPDRVRQTLKTAAITDRRAHASCNGYGQGVLALSLEKSSDPLVCLEMPGDPAPV